MFHALGSALIQLVLWMTAFVLLLRDRFEPPADWMAGLVMGFGAHLIVGMLVNAWRRGRELGWVRRAVDGQVLRDGEPAAVLGVIEPLAEPLVAPLSGQVAVAYQYMLFERVRRYQSSSRRTVVHFSGFGLAPCAIRSTAGNVRLMGFPALKDANAEADIELAVAKERLEGRAWKRIRPLDAFREVERMIEDADGSVVEDFRMSDRESIDGLLMNEERVEPGARVCAIGRWSAAKNGLVPSKVGTGESLKLLRVDDGPAAVRSLRASRNLLLIAAVLTLAFLHGGGWLLLKSREGESKVIAKKEKRWWTAIEEDRVGQAKRITKRLPVDYRDGEGRTALMYARSPEMVSTLLALGADPNAKAESGQTPLMRTAWQVDDPEMAKRLLDAGAQVNAQDQIGETPLGFALSRGHERVAAYLRSRGGR